MGWFIIVLHTLHHFTVFLPGNIMIYHDFWLWNKFNIWYMNILPLLIRRMRMNLMYSMGYYVLLRTTWRSTWTQSHPARPWYPNHNTKAAGSPGPSASRGLPQSPSSPELRTSWWQDGAGQIHGFDSRLSCSFLRDMNYSQQPYNWADLQWSLGKTLAKHWQNIGKTLAKQVFRWTAYFFICGNKNIINIPSQGLPRIYLWFSFSLQDLKQF